MDLAGRTVLIVGLGRSGIAAAKLCLAHGARVLGTDTRTVEQLDPVVLRLGVELFLGGHDAAPFDRADFIVVSPGVPALPHLASAEQRGARVIGELEFGFMFCSVPLLAVGGTNGKSTTTTLLAHLLQAHGLRVFSGGNLGAPVCEAALNQSGAKYQALVVEVSSFQLERAPSFRPKVSVLLNITADHLDRYASFHDYAQAKGNAFAQQQADDFAIVPALDALCIEQARRGRGKLVTFALGQGSGREVEADYMAEHALIRERVTGVQFDLGDVDLHGTHNWLNAAAAIASARCFGVSEGAIAQGLRAFKALPHRMALAGVLGGVRYYDDSKGTNVGAAVTALVGLAEERAVLIAGGRDKQGSYAPLREALAHKGRAVVLIGEAADRIEQELGGVVPVERAGSMQAAVGLAAKLAQKGDAVLLSPACSSFDMFSGYAARGDAFVAAVSALKEGV